MYHLNRIRGLEGGAKRSRPAVDWNAVIADLVARSTAYAHAIEAIQNEETADIATLPPLPEGFKYADPTDVNGERRLIYREIILSANRNEDTDFNNWSPSNQRRIEEWMMELPVGSIQRGVDREKRMDRLAEKADDINDDIDDARETRDREGNLGNSLHIPDVNPDLDTDTEKEGYGRKKGGAFDFAINRNPLNLGYYPANPADYQQTRFL